MDDLRRIRFLFPPFVMMLSLAYGACLRDMICLNANIKDTVWASAFSLLTAGAVAVLAGGYLLGTISGALFAAVFKIQGFREVRVSDDCLFRIRRILKVPQVVQIRDHLYPLAVFDHAVIHPKLHEWLQRRWHTCYTSMNCAVALVLSMPLGLSIGIPFSWPWLSVIIGLTLALVAHVWRAWHDLVYMIEFQSYGPFPTSDANGMKSSSGS